MGKIKDLTGKKFGRLTAIKIDHLGIKNKAYWLYDMYCEKFPYCNSFCRAMAERILQNNIRCCDSLVQMQEWIDKMENNPIQLSLF